MIKYYLKDIKRVDNVDAPNKELRLHSGECNWLYHGLFDRFIDTLEPEDFIFYQNTNALKVQLAEFHDVKVENIFIGPGSDACIKTFIDLFEAGTELWTTTYHFPMYEVYAKLNHLCFKTSPSPKEKPVVILSNPNSPLGRSYTKDELQISAQTNGYLLIDEAYIDYTVDPVDTISLLKEHSNVVVTRSLSKGLSGAGARVGYCIASAPIIELMGKFRSMFELTGASIKFASFVLDNYAEFKEYCTDTILCRTQYKELLRSKGYEVRGSQGNWIHVEQTNELVEYLSNHAALRTGTTLPNSNLLWIRLTVMPGLLDWLGKSPSNH